VEQRKRENLNNKKQYQHDAEIQNKNELKRFNKSESANIEQKVQGMQRVWIV
jgi:hypothetical protein